MEDTSITYIVNELLHLKREYSKMQSYHYKEYNNFSKKINELESKLLEVCPHTEYYIDHDECTYGRRYKICKKCGNEI